MSKLVYNLRSFPNLKCRCLRDRHISNGQKSRRRHQRKGPLCRVRLASLQKRRAVKFLYSSSSSSSMAPGNANTSAPSPLSLISRFCSSFFSLSGYMLLPVSRKSQADPWAFLCRAPYQAGLKGQAHVVRLPGHPVQLMGPSAPPPVMRDWGL